MMASFNPRRMSFWNDYYPKLVQLKFDTNKKKVSSAATVVIMGTIEAVFQVAFVLIVFMTY